MMNHNGNSSFGDLLTGTMNSLGFQQIQSYLNDKLISVYPPYDSIEQQAVINVFLTEGHSDEERQKFDKNYQNALYHGNYIDFLKKQHSSNQIMDALKNETYFNAGTSLMYLISGKK
jgi:hypothetical protein